MKKAMTAMMLMVFLFALSAAPARAESASSGFCGFLMTWTLDSSGTMTISGWGKTYDYTGEGFFLNYALEQPAPWYDRRDSINTVIVREGVTRIGSCAFTDCTHLSRVTLPASLSDIDYSAFIRCPGLVSFEVAPDNAVYRSEDGVLFDRKMEKLIFYPGGKEGSSYAVPSTVRRIGAYAFSGENQLTDISIPLSVAAVDLGNFGWSSRLERVHYSGTLEQARKIDFSWSDTVRLLTAPWICSDGEFLFTLGTNEGEHIQWTLTPDRTLTISGDGPTGQYLIWLLFAPVIRTVRIEEGVTDVAWACFLECAALTRVEIPVSVTSIGEDAFYGCESLCEVVYAGTEEQWAAVSIGEGNECLTGASVVFKTAPDAGQE